jgi:hypothetical protein
MTAPDAVPTSSSTARESSIAIAGVRAIIGHRLSTMTSSFMERALPDGSRA